MSVWCVNVRQILELFRRILLDSYVFTAVVSWVTIAIFRSVVACNWCVYVRFLSVEMNRRDVICAIIWSFSFLTECCDLKTCHSQMCPGSEGDGCQNANLWASSWGLGHVGPNAYIWGALLCCQYIQVANITKYISGTVFTVFQLAMPGLTPISEIMSLISLVQLTEGRGRHAGLNTYRTAQFPFVTFCKV